MLAAVSLTFLLQLAVIYVPFLQGLLDTTALSLADLGVCLAASTVVFWAVETAKWMGRRGHVSGALQDPG